MTTPEILSLLSSLIGIIGGPISVYFSWKAARKASQAAVGNEVLAKRLTGRSISEN